MINNSIIYQNPAVPPGYYYAELESVLTEDTSFDFPKILAELRILPNQGAEENTVLAVIIHPVEQAQFYMQNFRSTFPAWDDFNQQPQLGQIGSVEVYDAEYNGTKYSAVKFIYQPANIRKRSLQLWQQRNDN